MPFPRKYETIRERLTATVQDGEHPRGCWIGTDVGCRYGYQRQTWWIVGQQKTVKLTTHILLWVLEKFVEDRGYIPLMDELYLAYLEFRCSGLELDHTCDEPACRRPDHLEPKTHSQNIRDGNARWAQKRAATLGAPIAHTEHDEADVEF